jgi:hypothetical protein
LLVCLRPLPSWSQGPAKRAIVELVARITKKGGPEFVPPAERIAAFDNDGTLWAEQPLYVQVVFAMDRVKTFIVSGGDIDFMRPWVEKAYGVPPEQVVGSSVRIRFELRDGKPVLAWLPTIDLIDDGPGKPVGISKFIGRRPMVAFGNSDGDFEMLEWTTVGSGARLGFYVHHDDAKREWAYDRDSPVGRLARGLDAAPKRGWIIISMKNDWKRVFPFERP